MSDASDVIRRQIEARWKIRVKNLYPKLKPHMVKYRRLQAEFFCGALEGINAVAPAKEPNKFGPLAPTAWVVNLMAGLPLEE